MFKSLEIARCNVRHVRGQSGIKSRKEYRFFNTIQLDYNAGGLNTSGLPLSETLNSTPVHFIDGKWLVMCDLHFPWQNNAAIEIALNEGKNKGVTHILLNGDIADCYQLSWFWRLPNKAFFIQERYALAEFFDHLREIFPKAKIYWKLGNHDSRLESYMATHAPEIYDEEIHNWNEMLKLTEYGVKVINDWHKIYLGKLLVIHGHEFGKCFAPPVTAARRLFLQTKYAAAMCGHYHQTSSNNEMNANGDMLSTWSVGCLCNLSPRYKPITNWNNGFSVVNIEDHKGNFEVDNYRILPSGKLVK